MSACLECAAPIGAGLLCGACLRACVEVQAEPAEAVTRRLQAAIADRRWQEWRQGRRTYVIESGWQQRAGRSTLDGEIRLQEVA